MENMHSLQTYILHPGIFIVNICAHMPSTTAVSARGSSKEGFWVTSLSVSPRRSLSKTKRKRSPSPVYEEEELLSSGHEQLSA